MRKQRYEDKTQQMWPVTSMWCVTSLKETRCKNLKDFPCQQKPNFIISISVAQSHSPPQAFSKLSHQNLVGIQTNIQHCKLSTFSLWKRPMLPSRQYFTMQSVGRKACNFTMSLQTGDSLCQYIPILPSDLRPVCNDPLHCFCQWPFKWMS